CAAAKMPRAQSGRKCLAVHARQLALEPSLQILRRSRRPLLQRLEQAGRSALAHYVHWTAPMGARVLIKGNWYYWAFPPTVELMVPCSPVVFNDIKHLARSMPADGLEAQDVVPPRCDCWVAHKAIFSSRAIGFCTLARALSRCSACNHLEIAAVRTPPPTSGP